MRSVLRQAIRRYIRRPALAGTVVTVLALGIGATASMFSVVDAVLLWRAPWPTADRLVIVHAVLPDQRTNPALSSTWNRAPLSWASWRDMEASSAFSAVGVWMPSQHVFLGNGAPQTVPVFHSSSSFFSVLGVVPRLGRLFTPAEDKETSDSVIVSYTAWQTLLGGRPDIVGQAVSLATMHSSPAVTRTIVGVLPEGFEFQGSAPDFVLPMGLMLHNGSFESNRFLRAVGLLSPGISIEQALAISEPLVRRDEAPSRRSVRILSLTSDRFGTVARPLWLMFAGTGLLLAIACSNVAGLLLVDARAREGEVRLRFALGASKRNLWQQLLVEYSILALVASAVGVLLAYWFTPILVSVAPIEIRGVETIAVNRSVVAWSVCTGSLSTLFFGAIPALRLAVGPADTHASRVTTERGHRFIVGGQLAVAYVLVVCGAIFGQTMLHLQSTKLGFDPDGLAVVSIRLTRPPAPPIQSVGPPPTGAVATHQDLNSSWAHSEGLAERLAALPGVIGAAGVSAAPFTVTAPVATLADPEGRVDPQTLQWRDVTSDFFKTMGIPIVAGRGFIPSDRAIGTPYWAIVSLEQERRLGGNAVGKRFTWAGYPLEIVGVVGDIQQRKASDTELPALYFLNLRADRIGYFLIRTSVDPRSLSASVRNAVDDFDSSIQVTTTSAMTDLVADSMADERFRGLLSTVLASVALVLASVGLFGLTSYAVANRRQEIAIRTALGARSVDIRRLVLRDAALTVTFGLGAGLPISYAVALITRSMLFGVPLVPVGALLLAVVGLCVAAAMAVAVPILRAAHIDAAKLLRT